MKKSASFRIAGLVTAIASLSFFNGPVLAQMGMGGMGPNLDNMFLDEDTDNFDPGLPIGAEFPAIRAVHDGEEITDIDRFFGDKGAVFLAMRSVDW